MKLGRPDEARAEFERAAALTRNQRERDLSDERAARRAAAEARRPRRRVTLGRPEAAGGGMTRG